MCGQLGGRLLEVGRCLVESAEVNLDVGRCLVESAEVNLVDGLPQSQCRLGTPLERSDVDHTHLAGLLDPFLGLQEPAARAEDVGMVQEGVPRLLGLKRLGFLAEGLGLVEISPPEMKVAKGGQALHDVLGISRLDRQLMGTLLMSLGLVEFDPGSLPRQRPCDAR